MKLVNSPHQLQSAVIVTVCILLIAVIVLIRGCCYANEIDDLIPYIISCESGGNPQAVGKDGEIGLCQISPIVLKEWNSHYHEQYLSNAPIISQDHNLGDLYNPQINVKIGTWYLNRLRDHYLKDHYTIYTLLASYNWGIGNVKKVNYNPQRFPRSVKRYINKVLTIWNKAHPLDRKELLNGKSK